jgi:2-polyprenyl-3-methyl-5-hydroxy-6-metoxy-1,4-benzoquinol methylase
MTVRKRKVDEKHLVRRGMTFDVPLDHYKAFEHAAWERAAANYADSFEAVTALFAQPLLDAAGCGAGLKILDVACGSGMQSAMAASQGASATGIDFSPAMIAAAKGRFPSLSFIEADADRLPLRTAHTRQSSLALAGITFHPH